MQKSQQQSNNSTYGSQEERQLATKLDNNPSSFPSSVTDAAFSRISASELLEEKRQRLAVGVAEDKRIEETNIGKFLAECNLAGLKRNLERFRLPISVFQAESYISKLIGKTRLLNLYCYFFPMEWNNSTAPLLGEIEEGVGISPRELEFLNLVDSKLFPIYVEWFLDLAYEDDYELGLIPVVYQDLDYWQTDISMMRLAWQLLLILSGEVDRGFSLPEEYPELLELAEEQFERNQIPKLDNLKSLCTKHPNRIFDNLPLTIQTIGHCTNCVFIDANEESYSIEASWEIEDINWLAEEYKLAKEVWEKVDQFLDWLEVNPIENYKEVIELWNEALAMGSGEAPLPSVTTTTPTMTQPEQ